jgi:antitoxin component YwqK of YwqJK toxin-antitoxin module
MPSLNSPTMTRFTFFIICCLSSYSAMPCSCPKERDSPLEVFLYDGLVFKGRVIALDTVFSMHEKIKYPYEIMASFMVDTWISAHDIRDTVTVYTGIGGGDCGIQFSIGDTWLVYTREYNGMQTTSICEPTSQMTGKSGKARNRAFKNLQELKSTTGLVQGRVDWYTGSYLIKGNLKNGKPVGKWLRLKDKDTIAIVTFDDHGRRQGYQLELDKDGFLDYTFESFEQVSNTNARSFDPAGKILRSNYELKNALRHGKLEVYREGRLYLRATYVEGRLQGEHVTWHEDSAISRGTIKTVRHFVNDKLIRSARFDEAGNVIEN